MRLDRLCGDGDISALVGGPERDGETDSARAPVMKRVFPFNDIGVSAPLRSFGECCLRTGDAVGTFDDTEFKTARLNREVFCKKACESGTAGSIAGAQ